MPCTSLPIIPSTRSNRPPKLTTNPSPGHSSRKSISHSISLLESLNTSAQMTTLPDNPIDSIQQTTKADDEPIARSQQQKVNLPLDILARVAEHLSADDDAPTLAALSLVSRDTYLVANPLLWRKVTISSDRIAPALETLDFFPEWDVNNEQLRLRAGETARAKGSPAFFAAIESLVTLAHAQLHPVEASSAVRMMYNLGHIRTLILAHQPPDEMIRGFYRFCRVMGRRKVSKAQLDMRIEKLVILPELLVEIQENEWNDRPVPRYLLASVRALASPREACVHYPIFDTPPPKQTIPLEAGRMMVKTWAFENMIGAMFWCEPSFLSRFQRVEGHNIVWNTDWPAARGAANRYTFARYPMVQRAPQWRPQPHLHGLGPPLFWPDRAASICDTLRRRGYDVEGWKGERGNQNGTSSWEFIDASAMLREMPPSIGMSIGDYCRAQLEQDMAKDGMTEPLCQLVLSQVKFTDRDTAIKNGETCCGVCGAVVLEN
nr:sphingoid long-chain base transporter [Naematelia aurantialba]